MRQLNPATVESEIAALLAEYPELAEDETLRADMLAGSTSAFECLSGIVRIMQEAKALAAATLDQSIALRARSLRFARREDAMRKLAERLLRAADLRKAELPEGTLSLRAVPAALIIEDETELPDEFWRVTRAPDKAAIKDALKDGRFVPGAALGNGGETLSVRIA